MNQDDLVIKVLIERRILRASGDDDLQKVATVYVDGDEYRVLAPAKAVGDATDWVPHFRVHRSSPDGFGSDIEVQGALGILVIREVQERLRSETDTRVDVSPEVVYYHVRLHTRADPKIEVRFDLARMEIEQRILEPYRNRQPIVLGGRTLPLRDLERIEIFESPRSSSQFGEWTLMLARNGTQDCFCGEPDVKNVTDELITTPVAWSLPQKKNAIELLCIRFQIVAGQLLVRREERPTLDVKDEYDVQDLFHALLRIFFDDVRPEEWTPNYAGKSSRMDFLLPTEQLVIEVKKTRGGLDAKEIGSQLIEDIARYKKHPSCKKLVCFVYDPERRVANPCGIENDLSGNNSGLEVQVIIAPRG